MNILFGYRMNVDAIKMISEDLKSRGYENTFSKRDSKRGLMMCIKDGTNDGPVTHVVVMGVTPAGAYSAEELVYMRLHQNIRVIPIVASKHRGSTYMKTLLENGIYDALYAGEVSQGKKVTSLLEEMLIHGRSFNAAKEYYGF
jgi:hypothetical protein